MTRLTECDTDLEQSALTLTLMDADETELAASDEKEAFEGK